MDLHRATLALHDLEVDAEGWLVGAGVEHVPSTPAQSAWLRQHAEADVAALTFDERLALVEAEWTFRENRRLSRGLREAKLKLSSACLEDIDYSPRRELDKSVVRQLASSPLVAEHQAF